MGGKRAAGAQLLRTSHQNKKGGNSDDEYFSNSDDGDYVPKINMMCKHAKYIEIKEAANSDLKFHLTKKEKCDWDIWWSENPINS